MEERPIRTIIEQQKPISANAETTVAAAARLMKRHHIGALLVIRGGRLAGNWLDRLRGKLEPPKIDWVGTSMGGLIGMFLAAKRNAPIRRLVLNDVGAFIPWGALVRMKGSITRGRRFSNLEEVEAYVRKVCDTFGPLTDAQWKHLAVHSVAQEEKGDYVLRYDPAIGEAVHGSIDSEMPIGPNVLRGVDLWNIWGRLKCPTLVLRGAESDVLVASTVKEMRQRRPDTVSVEFEGVGHVPALMSEDQIAPIRQFLLQP